jgi:hypothetical protein
MTKKIFNRDLFILLYFFYLKEQDHTLQR